MTKKAYFYDPYIDTIGGGERYTFTLADYLIKKEWNIIILDGNKEAIAKLNQRFGLDLIKAELLPMPKSIIERWKMTRNADLFFWVSDGSVPWLFSKKNILHFQVPFHNVNGRSLQNQLKLKKISSVVCNSEFTKGFIDKEFGIDSIVIYPPVEVGLFKPKEKENIILAVGRFSQLLQAKRQDILIEVFKKMVDDGLIDWQLVLIGGADVGATGYLEKLKSQSRGYPIEVLENLPFEKVQDFYGKAKIFWNASGFGIDEDTQPEKVEHFGMVVVEAMAAGCVPMVVGKGGIKEIVTNKRSGFFWKTEEELIQKTNALIKDGKKMEAISDEAVKESKKYGLNRFYEDFEKII